MSCGVAPSPVVVLEVVGRGGAVSAAVELDRSRRLSHGLERRRGHSAEERLAVRREAIGHPKGAVLEIAGSGGPGGRRAGDGGHDLLRNVLGVGVAEREWVEVEVVRVLLLRVLQEVVLRLLVVGVLAAGQWLRRVRGAGHVMVSEVKVRGVRRPQRPGAHSVGRRVGERPHALRVAQAKGPVLGVLLHQRTGLSPEGKERTAAASGPPPAVGTHPVRRRRGRGLRITVRPLRPPEALSLRRAVVVVVRRRQSER